MPHADPEKRKAYAKAYHEANYSYLPTGRPPGRPGAVFQLDGEPAKRCTHCKEIKLLTEYYIRKSGEVRKIGKPYASCKACAKILSKISHDPALRKTARAKDKIWCLDLKSQTPCKDCQGIFHPACMEFDHINPSDKAHTISGMIKRGYKRSKVLAEMGKCELVCANCHRIREVLRKEAKGQGVVTHPKFFHVPESARTLAMTEQDFLIER